MDTRVDLKIGNLIPDYRTGARDVTRSQLAERLLALVDELESPVPPDARLMVRAHGRIVFVEPNQIDWIEAQGNYARLHVGRESYLIRDTMTSLQTLLGEQSFFRIHRSRIVNLARIKELRIAGGGDYKVVLTSGAVLGLSRLYRSALERRLTLG